MHLLKQAHSHMQPSDSPAALMCRVSCDGEKKQKEKKNMLVLNRLTVTLNNILYTAQDVWTKSIFSCILTDCTVVLHVF